MDQYFIFTSTLLTPRIFYAIEQGMAINAHFPFLLARTSPEDVKAKITRHKVRNAAVTPGTIRRRARNRKPGKLSSECVRAQPRLPVSW